MIVKLNEFNFIKLNFIKHHLTQISTIFITWAYLHYFYLLLYTFNVRYRLPKVVSPTEHCKAKGRKPNSWTADVQN